MCVADLCESKSDYAHNEVEIEAAVVRKDIRMGRKALVL